MKLTWTYYPRYESQSVTLTVIYVPELDLEKIPSGGFLVVDTNTAYVDWTTYKRFDSSDLESRKDAFGQLTSVRNIEDIMEVLSVVVQDLLWLKPPYDS